MSRRRTLATGGTVAVMVAAIGGLAPMGREQPAATFPPPPVEHVAHADRSRADERRDDALRRARVWRPANPAAADLAANPSDPSGALSDAIVRCRFLPRVPHGTTPKFDCVLPDGEVVKVKYGDSDELHAELAASRLLTALGFGADQMFLVPRVRCYGCPRFPFYVIRALNFVGAGEIVARHMPDDRYTDFEWAAVERHFPGTEIKTGDRDGWAWFELDRVDPSGGASRAELDALRLIAMFLSHWDNKAPNQRLVCLPPAGDAAGRCPHPFAIVHDLGATFGPKKLELDRWEATPIWANAPRCLVSMKRFPYDGGTFADVQISEAGRALIARQLTSLRDDQIAALFTGARFPEYFGGTGRDADVRAWAQAFRSKVRQIATARCTEM